MDRPFPAYQGDEPYIFVSYLHKDASAVFPELTWLEDLGLNIWFDEGIEAGAEWREEIGRAIKHASLFLYFVSPESVQSDNCRKEVSLADKEHIPIVAIHLKNTDLPDGLDLTLSDRQAILKYEISKQEYQEKLQARISSYLDQPIIQSGSVERKKTVPIIASVIGIVVLVIGLFTYNQQDVQQVINAQPTDVATPDQTAKTNTNDKVDLTVLRSIAVLPFVNMSTNKETGFFADGLSEDIVENLAQPQQVDVLGQHRNIKIASRSASFKFTDRGQDPSIVGEKLKVAYLLEGSVRQHGDSLHITAQLNRTEDGFQVWSKSYERTLADGFGMQTALAANIAHISRSELNHDVFKNHGWKQEEWLSGIDPIAVQHYMNALDEINNIRIGEEGDFETYVQFVRNAVEVDANFYIGYIYLANAYFQHHFFGRLSLQEARPAAHAAINSALAISPDDSLYQLVLAQIHLFLDLDYAQAEAGFRQLLVFNPKLDLSHQNIAHIALREERTRDAFRQLALISESNLGWEAPVSLAYIAWMRCVGGDYERALKSSSRGLKLGLGGEDRALILRTHAFSLVMLGRVEEAKPFIEEGWNLERNTNPENFIALFANIGEIERAKKILTDPRFDLVNDNELAKGYLALGDIDNTFKSIRAGIEDHHVYLIGSLLVAEWWNPIRDDPRFDEMLELLDSKVTHTEQYLRDHNIAQGDQ